LLGHEATRIGLAEDGTVREVSVRERATGAEMSVQARWCISDIGPAATGELLPRGSWPVPMNDSGPTADGLKFQVLSEKSLVDHNGIMFCLGTKRISGLVQVSNAIPSAAPPGKHLVNTFQVLKEADIREERELGMEDLRYLYGPDAEFEIVHGGAFRRQWPVNRLRQGQDLTDPQPIPGLLMVGDAYKPSGAVMVDGVAGSVSRLRPLLAPAR